MKNIHLMKVLLALTIFAASCRKEQYAAPGISGVDTDTIVMNVGDKTMLAPSITNLKGNTYSWSVNGKETAKDQLSYTFEASAPGYFDVSFKVVNKGGADEQTFKIYVEELIGIAIDSLPALPMCNVLEISPTVTGPDRHDYQYAWSIGDSVISKELHLSFIAPVSGTYDLTFRASAGKQSTTVSRKITVTPAEYVKNAYQVLAYAPAPAKGHNWSIVGYSELWKYGHEFPLPYSEFLAKASMLRKENENDALVIGSWGGYAIFKFDHTVANVPGKSDIGVSATYSRLDLPAVYVAYDRNKNGVPDEDEWYEIKTEDYGLEDMPDYAITFTFNRTETDTRRVYSYFDWKDNQETPAGGEIGFTKPFSSYVTTAGTFSTKGFFPGYHMEDIASKEVSLLDGWKSSFTRTGKRITRNVSGAPPFIQTMNVDIDLAVNSKGESVQLPGIDFVKVQKVVYPMQMDLFSGDGILKDFNLEEERMLHVGNILDLHLNN